MTTTTNAPITDHSTAHRPIKPPNYTYLQGPKTPPRRPPLRTRTITTIESTHRVNQFICGLFVVWSGFGCSVGEYVRIFKSCIKVLQQTTSSLFFSGKRRPRRSIADVRTLRRSPLVLKRSAAPSAPWSVVPWSLQACSSFWVFTTQDTCQERCGR